MKKQWIALLLVAALLSGCGIQTEEPTLEPVPTVTELPTTAPTTEVTQPPTEPKPDPLTTHTLSSSNVTEFCFLNGNLVLSTVNEEDMTTLTIEGEDYSFEGHVTLSDGSAVIQSNRLALLDWQAMEYVVLNKNLEEVGRISLPEEVCGVGMTQDFSAIYYSIESGLWRMDTETGETWQLVEWNQGQPYLADLLFADRVVQCSMDDGVQNFYDSTTGELLASEFVSELVCWDNTYYWTEYDGVEHLLFGQLDHQEHKELYPNGDGIATPIPELDGVLIESDSGNGYLLDFYDLTTGHRSASIQLPKGVLPVNYQAWEDDIWFLSAGGATIYQWDLTASDPVDPAIYTNRQFTEADPDLDGLSQISKQAKALGRTYDVKIAVWDEIDALHPVDYALVRAYQVPLYRKSLKLVEEVLSQFPKGMLQQATYSEGPLLIALVQGIQGTEDGALTTAGGLQFWQNNRPCIVIDMADDLMYTLYHELEHLLDNYMWDHSEALYNWAALNPDGFTYDYDYVQYLEGFREEYLTGENQAFIDDYSMTFPSEDRARVFEYACRPEEGSVFQAPYLQKKLSVLCKTIREVFMLDPETTLIWEQYLDKTATPS